MIIEKFCTKENPMPLDEGPLAVKKGIFWHHDDIVDLDPDDLCERFAPFKCNSCGYSWVADLGD